MTTDTQAELTIVSGGKSIKMKPLTAREYAAFLRTTDSSEKAYELIEYYIDFLKSKAVSNDDYFEAMSWSDVNSFASEYIKANTVSPDDKKKSE